MMKQSSLIVTMLLAVLVCLNVPTVNAESGLKKISLTYSDHSPPNISGVVFFEKEYLPRVQKELAKIGYELDITFYHSESLFKYTEQVKACENGLIDMTLFTLDYETARAPLHEILLLPLMGYNESSGTRIWFDLQNTIPEFGTELGKFKELCHFMALPTVFNLNKTARVPEDFKGLKIHAAGMVADMLKAAGAEIVMQAPGEWRTALEKNLVDGHAMGISGIPMYNLQDVVKVHVQPSGDSLGLNGTSFIMNRRKFESLPPEVQKVLDESVMWASSRLTEIEMNNIPNQLEICRKAGNTLISLTPTEMMKWYVLIRPLHKQWIRRMDAMGLPGKKVYDEAKRLADKYKAEK